MKALGRWSGRALAVAVAVVLAAPCAAFAWSFGEDLAVARLTLPAGHPCRSGPVDVIPAPGLVIDGTIADGGAPRGFVVGGQWVAQTMDGGWVPLPCEMQVDPVRWAAMTACEQRRFVFHEVGHWAGFPDGAGIMDTYAEGREQVAVPGCPVVHPATEDLVVLAVLDRLPAGWGVSCGRARRGVWGCRADKGHRLRRYWVLVRGSRMTVRLVRRAAR